MKSTKTIPKFYMNQDKKFPAKYDFLFLTEKEGFLTPKTFFISERAYQEDTYRAELDPFLKKDKIYIIRSCIDGEDGQINSFAGHFASSEALSSNDTINKIPSFFQKNKVLQLELIPNGKTNLMVQEFIESTKGGIIFSPWRHFIDHFLVEITDGGAKMAVSGQNSQFFVLGTEENSIDPLPLPKTQEKLRIALNTFAKKLKKFPKFPADIEWCENENGEIVLLQLRPITRNILALFPAKKEQIDAEKKYLEKFSKTPENWIRNDLSESLGSLSPLSFDLFFQCYKRAQKTFQDLGFCAQNVDFFGRTRSGEIYIHKKNYQDFFAPNSLFSSFTQSFNEPKQKQNIQNFCENVKANNNPFSIEKLTEIFGYWTTSNVYFQLKLSSHKKSEIFYDSDEYELFFPKKIEFPKKKCLENWNDYRIFLKKLFLWESHKLRQEILKNPIYCFGTFDDFLKKNEKKCVETSLTEIVPSLYSFPSSFEENTEKSTEKLQFIVGKKITKGEALVITNPATFPLEDLTLPRNCILIAPYFKNQWIRDIDKFSGIILEQGGYLSHSAIVAREKNIPYVIRYQNATEIFTSGQKIVMDQENRSIK